jgi:hypothetical protein
MVRKPYAVYAVRINASRERENEDGKQCREERAGLHLQQRQGRLPLQSVHLQELQLLR